MWDYIAPFLSAAGTLLLILAIFVGAYYVSKIVGGRYRSADAGSAGNIEMIEKKIIGKEQYLAIVKVSGKTLLIGVTQGQIQKLEELDDTLLKMPKAAPGATPDFLNVFKETYKKAGKGKQKIYGGQREELVKKHGNE